MGCGLRLPTWTRAVVTAVLVCSGFTPLAAEKPKAVYYYVPAEDAWVTLSKHASQIRIVAPQVFMLDESGAVHGRVEDRVVQLARRRHIGIMPLLANDKPETAHNLLADGRKQQQVIAEALQRCVQAACIGLEVDLEGILQPDGPAFTEFVRQAAQAFHARDLLLSVAVPTPLLQPTPGVSYAAMFGGFAVVPQPYDLGEIGRAADFISLMTYGQYGTGTPPGPVASFYWVEQSIRYVLQFIPARKLSMGLGFWAYRWCNGRVTYSGYSEVEDLATQTGALPQWHAWYRSPWLDVDLNGCRTVIWYENERSLREKLKLVKRYHLRGYSAWRLGQEDPSFWRTGH